MNGISARRAIVSLLAAPLGAVLLAAPAFALVPHRPFRTLGREAERIAEGHVVATRAAYNAGHSRIYTYVTLDVERTLKGAGHARHVTFRVMGGEAEGVGAFVPDAPTFRLGEEILVLLGRDEEGALTVHGWKQGAHEIESGFLPDLGVPVARLEEALTGRGPDLPERSASTDVGGICPIACDTSTPLTEWPAPQLSTPFLVNPDPMSDCTSDEWLAAVAAAADTWNGAGSAFDFLSGGTADVNSKGTQPDGINSISVGSTGGSLAYTIVWYDPRTGIITENDMVISKTKRFFRWSCDPLTADPSQYDVQSAVVHEMGHFLYLDDLTDWDCRDLTMYGALYPGDLGKRTLEPADVCGIQALYP